MSRDPRRIRQILTLPQRLFRYLFGQPQSRFRLTRLFYDVGPPVSYYAMRYREKHPGPREMDREERMIKFLEKKSEMETQPFNHLYEMQKSKATHLKLSKYILEGFHISNWYCSFKERMRTQSPRKELPPGPPPPPPSTRPFKIPKDAFEQRL